MEQLHGSQSSARRHNNMLRVNIGPGDYAMNSFYYTTEVWFYFSRVLVYAASTPLTDHLGEFRLRQSSVEDGDKCLPAFDYT